VPVQPANPTVGDPIRVDFSKVGDSVRLGTLPADTEIVSSSDTVITFRAFRTGTVMLSGVLMRDGRAIAFRNLPIAVSSVLSAADDLDPAPLVPPKDLPENRAARIAIPVAATAAILAAAALWLRHRRNAARHSAPRHDERDELEELLRNWPAKLDDVFLAQVADVVRRRVSAADPALPLSLTSREVLAQAPPPHQQPLRLILEAGDRAKFSPFGAGEVSAVEMKKDVEQVISAKEIA
jgi:hypothetical protein